MAVTRVSGVRLPSVPRPVTTPDWIRPADWLAMPTLVAGDQRVVCLVHTGATDRNAVGILVAGNYTVDWGDGTAVQNFSSGVVATHVYDHTALPAGTQTSEGNRQALMVITPQAGQNLTTVRFDQPGTSVPVGYMQPYRDISVVGQSVSTFTFSSNGNVKNGARWFTYVGPSALVSLQQSFEGSFHLRGVSGTQWTSQATSFRLMFSTCPNLETVPTLDSALVTSMDSMFTNCYRLKAVPPMNTSNNVSFNAFLNGCRNLTSVPALDYSKAATMNACFNGCIRLETIPAINSGLANDFSSCFSSCFSLKNAPAIDTSNGVSFGSMFNGCTSLLSVPLFNTAKGTTFSAMFQTCYALRTVPSFDMGLGVSFTSIFQDCQSLESVTLNTPNGVNMTNFFWNCASLRTASVNCSAVPSAATCAQILGSTSSLASLILTGLRFVPGGAAAIFSNLQMGAAQLDAFYTSLGTASGAQSFSVAGNPGTAADNPAIATAKGWTVTGT